jgi:hypothetical protein
MALEFSRNELRLLAVGLSLKGHGPAPTLSLLTYSLAEQIRLYCLTAVLDPEDIVLWYGWPAAIEGKGVETT